MKEWIRIHNVGWHYHFLADGVYRKVGYFAGNKSVF
jgi:hypothetical protein